MFKMDRFTLIVILLVVLVLAGAVVTVNLTQSAGWGEPTYVDENSPEAAIQNAFVAFQRGDLARARQYYSSRVLSEENRPPFPGEEGFYYPRNQQDRRLRIVRVEYVSEDEALVTIAIDYFNPGGLFEPSSIWSSERVIKVVREDGEWKIDTPEFFY